MKKNGDIHSYVEIGDFIKISKGKKVESTSTAPGEDLLPIINIENVRGAVPTSFSCNKGVICNQSDILIVWDGANAGTVGTNLKGIIGSTIAKIEIESKEKVYYEYLFYFLKSKFEYLNQSTTGATIPHLDKSKLLSLKVELPSTEKQKYICSLLRKAEQAIKKRKATDVLMEQYLQSVFIEMFGEPVTNPKGWEKKDLGNVSHIQGGLQVTTKRADNPIELPYLRVANVYRDLLDLREIKTIKVTEAEAERVCLKKGDILVVEGHGNPAEIGRSAVWDGSIQICLHQNHLIRIRVDTDFASPVFISYYINSASGRQQMFKAGKTTSGLNTISSKNVKETLVLLPTLPLQNKFAAIVEKVEALKTRCTQGLAELQNLYGSLSQQAFKGELDL